MNLSALRTFAPAVRLQLIEAVTRKLDFVLTGDTADLRAMSAQRDALRKQAEQDRKGLIERVAYTWFNRLTALRFIDARGWHPFAARVIAAASVEETQPEVLRLVREGRLPAELAAHADLSRLNRLLDGALPSANPQGEVYRHLVLAACRFYHALLPDIFEKLNDETELLLPDDLLTEHSVVHSFRTEISDADCAEVEIIGWLYQFYISDKKDQVMARKSAVPTEDIPAVTQLFTPHWIVRYLVENSLGRLWLLNRPGSRLREHMPYHIDGEPETDFPKIAKPEEIRVCDPAAGSGHMLTYAFDLLTLIYEEEGYAPSEIPGLILGHNLHGLEICPRAAQLAQLALVFKARAKSRRFFQPEHIVRPRIIELRDVRFAENELSDYILALGLSDLIQQPTLRLLHQFEDAKNFGSLIQPCLDERAIADARHAIEAKKLGSQLFLRETHLKVLRVLEQAEALTQRYQVVVANPPYMGGKGMNPSLKEWLGINYPDERSDLMTCFMERCARLTIPAGFWAMINLPSWMFLSSYAILRSKLISTQTIRSLLHIGRGLFGPDFGTVAFVVQSHRIEGRGLGVYRRLFDKQVSVRRPEEIEALFLTPSYNVFSFSQSDFHSIPGCPIAYWVKPKFARAFRENPSFSDLFAAKQGMATGNNERFLRFWHEVALSTLDFNQLSYDRFSSNRKWFPYSKGGEARKWYGNHELIINWENNGEHLKEYKDADGKRLSTLKNLTYLFSPAITWSLTAISGILCTRFRPSGFVFDTNGMSAFPKNSQVSNEVGVAVLNSIVGQEALKVLNPTMAFQSGDIDRVPITKGLVNLAKDLKVTELIDLARADWDNFETSWDFRDQPLLRAGLKGATLDASWRNWEAQSDAAIRRTQVLETENNRLFIAAYGLDGELQPEVPGEQITLARAEARRDMAAFLSYAVGCMMGRYGLDHPGLILANAGDTLREFQAKVAKPLAELTFAPDEDGIIPILDGDWFEDDIVARTRDFLRTTFGDDTLNENIRFIEGSLEKDLRKYFLTDFYKNHISNERAYGYKKRPIYWLFRSPKGAFSALVYMHRMTRDTPNILLNRYLRNYLQKLRARIEYLDHAQASAATAREKTGARKESEQLKKNLRECEEWERDVLLPLAQSRPEIDLDDGVKVNYLKFGAALAPIPGLAAADDE